MDRVWWLPVLVCVGLLVVAVVGITAGVKRRRRSRRGGWLLWPGVVAGVLGLGLGYGLAWVGAMEEWDRPGAWWVWVAAAGTEEQVLRVIGRRSRRAGEWERSALVSVGARRRPPLPMGDRRWREAVRTAANDRLIDQPTYARCAGPSRVFLRDLWLRAGLPNGVAQRRLMTLPLRGVEVMLGPTSGFERVEGELSITDAEGREVASWHVAQVESALDWSHAPELAAGVYTVRFVGRELKGSRSGNAWLDLDVSCTLTVVAEGEPLVVLDTSGGPVEPRPRAVLLRPQADGSVRWSVAAGLVWPGGQPAVYRVSVVRGEGEPIVLGVYPMLRSHGSTTDDAAARLRAELEDGDRVTVRFEPDVTAMQWSTSGTLRVSAAEYDGVPVLMR